MAIQELYRTVRTLTRQLGLRESLYVIWAYSQYLQVNEFEIPEGIEVANQLLAAHPAQAILAEWTVEQMTREVIRHADEEPRRGRSLRQWSTLANIANTLRDLEGAIYAQLVGRDRIHLELMRIAHRQFVWQQHRFGWQLVIRYYKLFNTPKIVAHAQEATGLTIDEIYLIGMAYLGIFFGQPRANRQIDVQIPGLAPQHIDRFLAFTSLTRNQLSSKLRDEHVLDEGFAYRYSSLREFPLVQISYQGQDEIACPIPTLLFWRMTSGLYYSLRGVPGFPTAFGESFECYVGEVLRQRVTNAGMLILEEEEYHVGLNRKDSVDWIIEQGGEAALFIECKTKRLTWTSKAGLADLAALERDIRKLAGAVVQVYKTIGDYRAGRYPHLAFVEGRCIYPAVVTLEDLYLFGFDMPVRLDAAVRTIMEASGLPIVWLDEMPYSIMSIHELEKAAGIINAVGVHPFISGKVLDPELRRWGFGAYCNERYPDDVANLQHLFRDEFDAMFAGLA
jgi:hypothetical protein